MVHVPTYQEDDGRFTPLGDIETYRLYDAVELGQDAGLTFPGGVYARGWRAGGKYLRFLSSENRYTIYRDKDHYVTVSGGGAAPRRLGIEVLVVTGGTISIGDMGGVSGGGGGVAFNNIGKDYSAPLDYTLGLEHHYMTMIMLGGNVVRLEREREREIGREDPTGR